MGRFRLRFRFSPLILFFFFSVLFYLVSFSHRPLIGIWS